MNVRYKKEYIRDNWDDLPKHIQKKLVAIGFDPEESDSSEVKDYVKSLPRNNMLVTRVNKYEKEKIEENADKVDMTVSKFLRLRGMWFKFSP